MTVETTRSPTPNCRAEKKMAKRGATAVSSWRIAKERRSEGRGVRVRVERDWRAAR